jgi:acyl dehydratase
MELRPDTVAELLAYRSAPSDWLQITQAQIDKFADCTLDRQAIHVDPEIARKTPFGSTIAHGFLLLSLQTHFAQQCAPPITNAAWALNYGSDRVRFLSPVKVGSFIRAAAQITDVTQRGPQEFLVRTSITVEIRGHDKPALVADLLGLVVTRSDSAAELTI